MDPPAPFLMTNLAWLATAFGMFSHIAYFKNGEHHMYSVLYLKLLALLSIVSAANLYAYTDIGILACIKFPLLLETVYISSIFASMLIYRATFLHRLHKFPGPLSWKLTKLAQSWANRRFRGFEVLDRLHREHGEYVRTGPTEISVIDPDAVPAILSSGSSCIRSPWYELGDPHKSIFQTRSKFEHDKRRKVWDRGFSIKALRSYEKRVDDNAKELERQIAGFEGKPINVSLWFNYYSFDVMGDLVFGRTFEMLRSGTKHFAIKLLEGGQKGLGIFGPVPWLFTILTKIPGLSSEYDRFIKFCEEQVEERRKVKVDSPDVMSWLLDADPMDPDPKKEHLWITGDSRIAIVAGSDTVAAALTHSFYYLAKDPIHSTNIREELELLTSKDGTLDAKKLQLNSPYLNALINETLRLHPPNPSGFTRQTAAEGLWIGEHFIPGNVTLGIPLWALHRSSKCYVDPYKFIPERWTTRPDLLLRKDAYIPFSTGPYGCVGKQLGLMELRAVITRIVMHFDVGFAPGEMGRALLEDSEDYFTLGLAELMLEFRPRNIYN